MENESKIPLKSNIGKLLIFLFIVICIAIVFARYLINDDFRNEVDTKFLKKEITENGSNVIEINSDASPNIYSFDKYIAVISKKTCTFYNQNANIEAKLDVDITIPYFASNNKYIALAEKNGNKLYIISNLEIICDKELDGEIYRISVNENGYVTVLMKNTTYNSIIIVFDSEGEELFRSYLAKNYAICAEVSQNNKLLAIGQIDYSGTIIKSIVKLISIDLAKEEPTDAIIYTYESESNKILNNIGFNGKNEAICMFDSYIQKITELSDERLYDITNKDIFVDINLKDEIAIVEKESSGLFAYQYQLNLKNTEGKSDNLYILEKEIPKNIRVSKNLVVLNLVDEVRIINQNGWLLKKYITKNEIQDIVIGDSIVGIVYNNRIELINI